MATSPAFVSTPRIGRANLSTANTAINGTGTIETLLIGVAAGTRVLEINTQCSATSAAALVNIFLSLDSGTTWSLFDQVTISAATSSNTVKANRNLATYINLVLPDANVRLGCATTISQATQVWALAADLT